MVSKKTFILNENTAKSVVLHRFQNMAHEMQPASSEDSLTDEIGVETEIAMEKLIDDKLRRSITSLSESKKYKTARKCSSWCGCCAAIKDAMERRASRDKRRSPHKVKNMSKRKRT